MEEMVLSRDRARVHVVADEATCAKLRELSSPYLQVECARAGRPPGLWTLYAGRGQDFSCDTFQTYTTPSPGEVDRQVLVSFPKRTAVIDQPPGPWRYLYTLRSARNLLRWELLGHGAIYVHGGCVEVNGTGVAIIGKALSGKTSLAVATLALPGTRYVAEDDLTLLTGADGVRALGWPGSIRLRPDSLKVLSGFHPGIGERLECLTHPGNAHNGGASRDKRGTPLIHLFPHDLATRAGCRIAAEVRLGLIVFPEVSSTPLERPVVRHLDPATARNYLRLNWDVTAERRPGADPASALSGACTWSALSYDRFLADFFGVPDVERLGSALAGLPDILPCYRIQYTAATLAESVSCLARLATEAAEGSVGRRGGRSSP